MRAKKITATVIGSALLLGAMAIGFSAPKAPFNADADHCGPDGLPPEQFVAEYDADGNGELSTDEFPGPAHAFSRIDADGNGQVTAEEAAVAQATRHERRGMQGRRAAMVEPEVRWQRLLEHADADGNGVISEDEFPGPEHAFARLDSDEDGQITEGEGTASHRRMGEGGPHRRQMNPEARWQRMLERHDADNSGSLSADEFMGRDEVFQALDANQDGQITEEELGEGAGMRGRRMGPRAGGGQGQGTGPRAVQ